MDHYNTFEVQNKLLNFFNLSGEEWMLHVDSKYARTLTFKRALDRFYDEYVKEKNEPSFQMPRYRPGQEYDAKAVEEYARDAKLNEIVGAFWDFYQTQKRVLDSNPQIRQKLCYEIVMKSRDFITMLPNRDFITMGNNGSL